jgi:hypothetical protein
MPRGPQRATGDLAYLQIRLPGWLKNEVIDHCESRGISLNAWLVEALRAQLRVELEVPAPPPARAPLPTTADMIRGWATGERLIMPCGRNETCAGIDDAGRWSHDGMGFCNECGIRVV